MYGLLTLFLGCVTAARHELVEVQLEATRTALSAQQVASRTDEAARTQELVALRDEIAARQAQLDVVMAHHDQHDRELDELRARYAALVAEGLPEPREKPPHHPGRQVPLTPAAPRPVLDASIEEMVAALELASHDRFRSERMETWHGRVSGQFAPLVDDGFATVERNDGSSVVVLLAAQLFIEGTVVLSPRGEDIAKRVALAMGGLHGANLEIHGHTDATPFHSPDIASNWELGFARGMTLLRAMRENGVDEVAHVASFADTEPRVPADAPEASRSNARVELWLSDIPGIEERYSPTP